MFPGFVSKDTRALTSFPKRWLETKTKRGRKTICAREGLVRGIKGVRRGQRRVERSGKAREGLRDGRRDQEVERWREFSSEGREKEGRVNTQGRLGWAGRGSRSRVEQGCLSISSRQPLTRRVHLSYISWKQLCFLQQSHYQLYGFPLSIFTPTIQESEKKIIFTLATH